MKQALSLSELLKPYIEKIEAHLEKITHYFDHKSLMTRESSSLASALAYALQSGGKRIRPAITLMIAEALGTYDVLDAACSIELFHTASLIADDLPCMDDATERRGHLATHKAFNEATALLASYALIAHGYQLINQNALLLPQNQRFETLSLALQNATKNTGYFGASGGQFLDLFGSDSDINEVMTKKTAALFESSFLIGWVFSGKHSHIELVKQLGVNFGFAFQLIDDLLDYEEDKLAQRKINYAIHYGIEPTMERVHNQLNACKAGLQALDIKSRPLLGILELMEHTI